MLHALVLVFGLAQIAPTLAPDQARGCEVRGRVSDKDTGQPLARAVVRLHSADGKERFSARTDDTGRYRLTGLPQGQYTGFVDGGPFKATHDMGLLSGGARAPIMLKDGEVREIDVALPRTHAINVRVVDEWGVPLSGIMVTATALGQGNAALSMNHTTDDRGRERLFGLLPGRYIVCAQTDLIGFSPERRRDALLRTCHPSSVDEAEAQPVRVGGTDVGEIDIRMRTGRTFTIAGRVVDPSGAPAANARLSLSKDWPGGSASSVFQSVGSDGQFRLPSVQPGEYAIEASIGETDHPEHRRPTHAAFVPIRVGDADISDVLVALRKTVDVAGRIILGDLTAPFSRAPGYGPMYVWSRHAEDGGPSRSGVVDEEKRFTIEGTFGPRTIELMNVPRGWYVKSIRYAGNEIIDEPITFKESAEPAVEIVLSNRGASVTGRVTDDRGNAVQGATVLMFEADRERMSWRSPHATRTSASGAFRAGPVRAGEYFILAVPAESRPIQPGESSRLARLAASAERVTLGDLDERTIERHVVVER